MPIRFTGKPLPNSWPFPTKSSDRSVSSTSSRGNSLRQFLTTVSNGRKKPRSNGLFAHWRADIEERLVCHVGTGTALNYKTNVDLLFSENVSIIGSDDSNTCIIVVVRHSGEFLLVTATFSLPNANGNEAIFIMVDIVEFGQI